MVFIFRGTTPTFSFKLPIEAATITKLAVTFKQPGGVTVEKTLDDVTLDGQTVTATLTEEETLSFRAAGTMEIQLRVGVGAARMASQVWTVPVERVLKEGAL